MCLFDVTLYRCGCKSVTIDIECPDRPECELKLPDPDVLTVDCDNKKCKNRTDSDKEEEDLNEKEEKKGE